jgi:nucleotide-binding universal stress UspA family protein
MQILVPLDGSHFSEHAVTSAFKIARLSRATVHLVRVIRPAIQVSAEVAFVRNPGLREIEDEARTYLAEFAADVPPGVAARCVVLHGPDSVAKILSDYIARSGIGMVIMATHGRTGLGRFWLGSVADELVRTVRIPVLVLRPPKGDGAPAVESWHARRILVPLDGSERAEAALEAAVELGWLTSAHYTLVQVVKPPMYDTYPDTVALQIDEHQLQHDLDRAREYLDKTADQLRAVGLHVNTLAVAHPNIAEGIVHEASASNADLIALATHGRGGWKRLALGSVAQEVLHKAHLPLLLLRTAETAVDAERLRETVAAC